MAEITRRRTGELEGGVIALLLANPDGLKAREVLQRLETAVPPSAFESSEYPNQPGVRRYEKIVRFGSIPLVKAGWLTKTKGTWAVTDSGKEAYAKFHDPAQFIQEATRLYRDWKQAQPETESGQTGDEVELEAENGTTSFEEAEEAAWNAIEAHLVSLGPYDFQELVAALIRAMGYHVGWIAPPGPDRGIDIIAYTDPLGIEGPQIKIRSNTGQAALLFRTYVRFLRCCLTVTQGCSSPAGGSPRTRNRKHAIRSGGV